jgi:hypothetical protein
MVVLPYCSGQFSATDGAKIAVAELGPVDEGYVGGGKLKTQDIQQYKTACANVPP